MEQVTIIISEDGSAQVEVSCVKGKKCVDLTKDIEKALGATTKNKPTQEYFEKETAHATHRH